MRKRQAWHDHSAALSSAAAMSDHQKMTMEGLTAKRKRDAEGKGKIGVPFWKHQKANGAPLAERAIARSGAQLLLPRPPQVASACVSSWRLHLVSRCTFTCWPLRPQLAAWPLPRCLL